MADNNQTILVKKADGTFVRMALSDIKKPNVVKPEPVQASTPVAPPSISATTPSPKLTTTVTPPPKPKIVQTIIKSAPVPSPKNTVPKPVTSPKMTSADAISLLEETDLHHSSAPTVASATREDEVEKIFSSLGFSVLPVFANRLRSVIQQRLKGIRGETETRELVLKPTTDGGLGLSEGQADILEQKCSAMVIKNSSGNISNIKPLKTKELRDKVLQKFSEADLPANITPFNGFVHAPASTNLPKTLPLTPPVKATPAVKVELPKQLKPRAESFKISTESKPRPVMQDVTASPREMGPIEEVRYFRLLDLRRLASKPEEAVGRLKQKFINLKEESIVLFIDAMEAWHQCPLYVEYVQMVSRAFSSRTKLVGSEIGKDNITVNEIKLLVEMEKELGL